MSPGLDVQQHTQQYVLLCESERGRFCACGVICAHRAYAESFFCVSMTSAHSKHQLRPQLADHRTLFLH